MELPSPARLFEGIEAFPSQGSSSSGSSSAKSSQSTQKSGGSASKEEAESQYSGYEQSQSRAPEQQRLKRTIEENIDLPHPKPIIMLPDAPLTQKILTENEPSKAAIMQLKTCLVCQTKRHYTPFFDSFGKAPPNARRSLFTFGDNICDYCAKLKFLDWNIFAYDVFKSQGCPYLIDKKHACPENGPKVDRYRMKFKSRDTSYLKPSKINGNKNRITLCCNPTLFDKHVYGIGAQENEINVVSFCEIHSTIWMSSKPCKPVQTPLIKFLNKVKIDQDGCENVEQCSFHGALFKSMLHENETKALSSFTVVTEDINFKDPASDFNIIKESFENKRLDPSRLTVYCQNCMMMFKHQQIEEDNNTSFQSFPINVEQVQSFWSSLRATNPEIYALSHYQTDADKYNSWLRSLHTTSTKECSKDIPKEESHVDKTVFQIQGAIKKHKNAKRLSI